MVDAVNTDRPTDNGIHRKLKDRHHTRMQWVAIEHFHSDTHLTHSSYVQDTTTVTCWAPRAFKSVKVNLLNKLFSISQQEISLTQNNSENDTLFDLFIFNFYLPSVCSIRSVTKHLFYTKHTQEVTTPDRHGTYAIWRRHEHDSTHDECETWW